MDSAPITPTETGNRIPTRIWMLAGTGIASGALILGLLTRHLLELDTVSRTAQSWQQTLHSIIVTLHGPVGAMQASHDDLFVRGEAPPPLPHPRSLLLQLRALPVGSLPAGVQARLNSLAGEIAEIATAFEASHRWFRTRAPVQRKRQMWLDAAYDALREFDDHTTTMLREELARRLALFEELTRGSLRQMALLPEQVPDPRTENALHGLRDACKQLEQELAAAARETNPRRLRRMRDQDVKRALEFVATGVHTVETSCDDDASKPLRVLALALAESLFGSHSSDTETVGRKPRPGFFTAHAEWIAHDAERQRLQTSLQRRIDSLRDARADLERLLSQSILACTGVVSGRVTHLWQICLGVSAAAALLLLILARAIGRGAKAQIRDLHQARLEAGQAVKAQSLFLANMSHEIRTPMNGVLGMAEMLEAAPLPDEQRMTARTIRTSAEALLTVINDILDFSKIQAGKLELDPADFDLRDTIEDTIDLLAHLASAKGVELLCDIDNRVPPKLHGDAGRLRQILLNLTGNAIKFTPEGEVTLRVELLNDYRDEIKLQVQVCDTGVGIPADVQSRLFRPFTQADATTTRRFGGTGLGLTISKRLIQIMGGDIHVHSEPGQGATFTFTLTLGPAAAEEPAAPPVDLHGRSVLIVDDNQTGREILGSLLASWHLGFDFAANADEALERLREARQYGYHFDIALIDLGMPGRNGIELAQEIEADPNLAPTLRILMSSGGPQPHDQSLDDLGLDAWLTKPVRHNVLRRALEDALDLSSDADAAARPEPEAEPPVDLHVLVAEDNAINQRVIDQMLRHIGCTAEFATNGREALELLDQGDFDLILMDCQMPEMDGFTATRTIRQLPGPKRDIPIVALTANVLPADRRACADAGMNGFLPKPIKKAQLRDAIARSIQPASEPG